MTLREKLLRRKRKQNALLQASKPEQIQNIHIGGPCEIQAAKDDEDESLPTFRMVANTGVPMMVGGYYRPVIMNMKGVKFSNKVLPVIADHDNSARSRVGHTTSIKKDASTITVEGVVSATGATALEIIADAKNGFPFQASLGATVQKAQHIPEDSSVRVNGQMYKGPLVVAQQTTIYEFTVTSIGADQSTSFDVAATYDGNKEIDMNFQKWLEARKIDADTLTDEQTKVLELAYKAEMQAARDAALAEGDDGNDDNNDVNASQQNTVDDIRAAARAERIRATRFTELEKEYSNDLEASKLEELRLQADTDNWDADLYELHLRRNARPPARQFAIHGSSDRPISSSVVECSLLAASGYDQKYLGENFTEDVINASLEKQNRTYGLKRLCHEVIQAAGMYYPFGVYDNGFVEAVMSADRRIKAVGNAPGATSPISVAGILSNVMNKILLQSFMGDSNGMATLMKLCSTRSVTDFKDHPVFRLTGVGEYGDVQPGGELKGMSLGEEQATISADTRGVLIVLDRTHIVNDDLGAFTKIPAIIGRKARMKFLKVGYGVFLDDANFFTTTRGNLLESTAFDIDGITAAVRLFRKMKDIGGDPVDVNPSNLITSSLYEVPADQFYRDTTVMVRDSDAAASATTLVPNSNPHRGKYVPSSTSWLDTDSVAGGGADDSWYITSSEDDMKPLQVAYLNGVQVPTTEQCELPADRLGVGWRSYFDFGFARQEWRGAVKVLAGAAVLLAAMEANGDKPKPATLRKKAR